MQQLTRGECKSLAYHRVVAVRLHADPALSDTTPVPEAVVRSREADLIPASNAAKSIDLIDGALGLDSTFDGTPGYHADAVEVAKVSCAQPGGSSVQCAFVPRRPMVPSGWA